MGGLRPAKGGRRFLSAETSRVAEGGNLVSVGAIWLTSSNWHPQEPSWKRKRNGSSAVRLSQSIAGSAELAEDETVAANERSLLRSGPALELGLTATGFGESEENFDSKDRNGPVDLRCSAGLTGHVVV